MVASVVVPSSERLAVRLGLGHQLHADDGVAAAAVLDDHLLAEQRCHLLGDQAARRVGGAARDVRHHDLDRPIGPSLGAYGRGADDRPSGSTCQYGTSLDHCSLPWPRHRCHSERSEGPLRQQERSLATLGMTAVPNRPLGVFAEGRASHNARPGYRFTLRASGSPCPSRALKAAARWRRSPGTHSPPAPSAAPGSRRPSPPGRSARRRRS